MANSISAAQQFKAIAYLRWRLFANGFRRKGGTGELIARIIVFPIGIAFVVGPAIGSGALAYAAVHNHNLFFLPGIFWGIFIIQIIVSINISPPGLSFDPESLIRFPLNFTRYLTVRLFLGLLSVSTIIGTVSLLTAALGASIADSSLAPVAFAAALALALCNMLFVRMVFAWVDRWLSTRRARELFTVLIFAFSIGIQYANVTFNGIGAHGAAARAAQKAKVEAMLRAYAYVEPVLHRMPQGLAGSAIVHASQGQFVAAIVRLVCVLIAAAIFLSVFAWRMQREYRGENLSEVNHTTAKSATEPVPHLRRGLIAPKVGIGEADPSTGVSGPHASGPSIQSVVTACFEKEWISVRRNPAQFYGLLMPLAMVFIFASRLGAFAKTGMIFPAAVAYSVLGVAALAYNIFGLDAAGIQFYCIAPITFRSIVLAKNLFGFLTIAIQLVLVYAVLAYSVGHPPILVTISTLCWVVFAALVNATVGNIRSITAPKKQDPGKLSRKQASQLSALMCIGIMILIAGIGAGMIGAARFFDRDWLPIPVLLVLAIAAFAVYNSGLNKLDTLVQKHRENMIEELCKAS